MIGWLDALAREVTLFACVGFLVGGLDDLAVDYLFLKRAIRNRLRRGSQRQPNVGDLAPRADALLAIYIAAWDESAVIGRMLRAALSRIDRSDYVIYVGTYPNDRETIAAVAAVAAGDDRIRLVINDKPGPTTKADCLNAIWRAMLRDEQAGAPRVEAVVLHDAEDLIDRDELNVHAAYLRDFELVQVPVLPLIDHSSRFVAGHYADEFAEAHGKQLPVRSTLGAGLPLAGVGCAIRRDMIERIAVDRDNDPFDASSLTEDYELGLTVKKLGGRAVFARVSSRPGGPPVAVRAYFPGRLDAAVRQKTRWMIGIALAGWDRVGWAPARDWRDHWMRMRDRRALMAVLVLATAYVAVVANAAAWGLHRLTGLSAPPVPFVRQALLVATMLLLFWRLGVRAVFVGRAYGVAEALLSIPRSVVGNVIALLAARRAVFRYVTMLRGGHIAWDKTSHRFPDAVEEAAT
ncbi:glycosyl transferase family protein [Stakelama marina]|uniref:Glycosyl transferase family protein n=1 Tax=Stakelama marina TaxID=2826939 RepID=A0A8T4IFH4_9SPHN|nr:glycosyl transferase family protein [Stakelama marina]MBR0553313.1 glycosyl transferase family protein [Stakelama marina]